MGRVMQWLWRHSFACGADVTNSRTKSQVTPHHCKRHKLYTSEPCHRCKRCVECKRVRAEFRAEVSA